MVLESKLNNKGQVVRLYTHCARTHSEGGVVLFGFNMGPVPVSVFLSTKQTVKEYSLQPQHDDIRSQNVLLNGRKLAIEDDKNLPRLKPTIHSGIKLVLKENSIVFWVLPDAGNMHCNAEMVDMKASSSI